MTPRMSTGFGGSDAKDDFDRARRKRAMARAAGTVAASKRTATDGLVPLAEVVAALGGRVSERRLGLRTVLVDAIVGTVDRAQGFDRRFLPTSSKNRQRWERIAQA
ncbi:MAG: chromosome partitioning protein ParB, partial [Actinomycetota bacterium]|nr:chromosome partitioning protein ParB [Actinomycetota bacterium]